MALIDVVLVLLLEVLTKKVNENNNQILREYFAFENTIMNALRNAFEKCRIKRMCSEDANGPRPLNFTRWSDKLHSTCM